MIRNVTTSLRSSRARDHHFISTLQVLRSCGLKRTTTDPSVLYDLGNTVTLPGGRQGPKPVQWRYALDSTRLLFIQRALEAKGPCKAFDLNLSHDVIAAARSHRAGFVDYVRRRVARHLTVALGTQPDFWFVIEQTGTEFPHLHGAVAVSHDNEARVREALKAAGGRWPPEARGRQLRLRAIFNGDGVVRYAIKSTNPTEVGVFMVGESFAVNRSLNASAKASYDQLRTLVTSLRRSKCPRSRSASLLLEADEAALAEIGSHSSVIGRSKRIFASSV